MGPKFYYQCQDSLRWYLGESVQIENAWVRASQNCIGSIRHGDSSEDIGSQWSKIEGNGEEEYRSETPIAKLWRQTRENRNKSGGQESKGKWVAFKEEKVLVTCGKKKASVRKETNAVSVTRPKIVNKKTRRHCRHAFWANRITRSKCVEEEYILRRPCRCYLKRCLHAIALWFLASSRVSILQNRNGVQSRGISVFPHHKVDEQPNKKPKKSYYPTKEESEDKSAMAIVKIVPQSGCVSQDLGALVCQRGKNSPRETRFKKVLGTIRKVRFAQSALHQASIQEKKDHRLEKLQVKPQHQRSPHTSRILHNMYKLKEKDKATFYSPAEEWVLPVASTKEPEEREFAVDSGASMPSWSANETLTLLSWRPWGTSRRRPTAKCATREEATVQVIDLDLIVTVIASWRKTPTVSFVLGSSARITDILTRWTSGQKPQLTKKGQENWLQYFKLCAIRSPMVFLRVPHTYFIIIFITGFCIWMTSTNTPKIQNQKDCGSTSEELRGNPLHKPTETENTIKMKDTKKYKAIYCMTCQIGCRSSERIWSMNVILQSHGKNWAWISRHFQFFSWITNGAASRSGYRVRVSTVSTRTFRRTRIATSVWRLKQRGLLAGDVLVQSCPDRIILVIW